MRFFATYIIYISKNLTLYAQWAEVGKAILFECEKFKAALIAEGVDTDGDGEITEGEALAVTMLGVSDCENTSMAEIKYFTQPDTLYCSRNNKLTSLDLSKNIELE